MNVKPVLPAPYGAPVSALDTSKWLVPSKVNLFEGIVPVSVSDPTPVDIPGNTNAGDCLERLPDHACPEDREGSHELRDIIGHPRKELRGAMTGH